MQFNGYYFVKEIACGYLLDNGIFYPCDYTKHSILLNHLINTISNLDKSNLVKFNSVGGFCWVDFHSPIKKFTPNQIEFINAHKDILTSEFYNELIQYV